MERRNIAAVEERVHKLNDRKVPIRFRILQSALPDVAKASAIRRLEAADCGSSSGAKAGQWVDALCMLPIGKFCSLPIAPGASPADIGRFLDGMRARLDAAVYGHAEAKGQVMRLIAQWITNDRSKGLVLGVQGSPGVGKTELCRAVCEQLGLPFGFVPLGGANDGCYLVGHSYTYEGAVWGKVADVLMKCRCMNPVLFFDELDKISDSRHGEEVTNILIHLTDPTQNDRFNDKFFMDIDLDLSKCLVIFSYNDESRISPVLRDRMMRVVTQPYAMADKLKIARNHLLPSVLREFAMTPGSVELTDDVLRFVVDLVEEEHGVRNLRRAIHDIVSHLNYERLTAPETSRLGVSIDDADRCVRSGRRDCSRNDARHLSMYS